MSTRPFQGLAAVLVLASLAEASAQDAAAYFKKSCTSCHTIGGGALTGPDLKDVTKRADKAWLVDFVNDPKSVIDKGDPYAAKLLREARGVVMPKTEGMTKDRAAELIALIEAESRLEKSQFKGLEVSDRPFVPADVEYGRQLFTGVASLKAGGAACISCHSAGRIAGLGGGHLGPDLTQAFARLEGRKALAAWLSAPATAVMGKAFGSAALDADEVLPLVAFLKDANERGDSPDTAHGLDFLVLGVAVAAGVLVLFDVAWKSRFRAVRGPLVNGGVS